MGTSESLLLQATRLLQEKIALTWSGSCRTALRPRREDKGEELDDLGP